MTLNTWDSGSFCINSRPIGGLRLRLVYIKWEWSVGRRGFLNRGSGLSRQGLLERRGKQVHGGHSWGHYGLRV